MINDSYWGPVLCGTWLAMAATIAVADGSTVDKVYPPYVEPLEWELEWRAIVANKTPQSGERRKEVHKLGLGRAVSEFVFLEMYVVGEPSSGDNLALQAYEVELLWQLSEQGEYAVDYGLLFELEKEHHKDLWEYTTTVLLEKEWGRFSGAANLSVTYEWGDDIHNEFETAVALQSRYRYSERFEPALELYVGQDTRALGPVIMGFERLGVMKALRWEIGTVFGLDSNTADYTLRGVLEYEF